MTSTTSTWDKLKARLDQVKKPTSAFRLCDDADIRDRYRTAKRRAEEADAYLDALDKDTDTEARAAVQKQATDAHTELAEAKKAYDAHTVVLRFTALERQQLEDLQNEHPASEADEAKGNDFAFDTFAPALISAASLDGMPVEDAAHYMQTWTAGDSAGLWRAAWSVQHQQRTDLGKD
ncbi:hypothetical protein [Streptomyces sp. NPDC001658]